MMVFVGSNGMPSKYFIFLEAYLYSARHKGGESAGSKNELSNPTSTQIYREDLQIVGTDFNAIEIYTFHLLFDNRFTLDFLQLSGGSLEVDLNKGNLCLRVHLDRSREPIEQALILIFSIFQLPHDFPDR